MDAIDNMRNLDYLMLLKCMEAHNKRLKRESESGGGGTSFIDKNGIRASDG